MGRLRSGGAFRHLIELQSRATTKGSMGGQSTEWTTYATVYAALMPLSGDERMAAQAVSPTLSHQIEIGWSPSFTPAAGHRAKLGSRIFDIRAVWNDDEANRLFVMQATELATQG